MTWLSWVQISAILGASSVILGAFGSHYIGSRVSAHDLDVFKIGSHYHQIHTVALLVISLLMSKIDSIWLTYSAWFMLLGVLIFSGSLYLLVLTGHRWLGAVTPIGGTLLIVSWLSLFWAAFR